MAHGSLPADPFFAKLFSEKSAGEEMTIAKLSS
jgi:hypothetical protein